jgi:hypothetical protein
MTMLRVPLTETDRAALRAMGHDIPEEPRTGRRVPGLPNGCDYQGRYPQAAEACTEIGAEAYSVSPVFEGLLSRWSLLSAVVMVGSIAAFVVWVTR